MKISYIFNAVLCLSGALSAPAQSNIILNTTRAIYPAAEHEITLKLTNDDASVPRLVQAWIDDGDADKTPDQIDVPFTLTPPVSRMDGGKSQNLRIVYTREENKENPLPKNKESVFWLNVLGIPPKTDKAEEQNSLQFAFRTRIKLFLRPEGIIGKVEDAPNTLQWKLITDGAEHALEVRNPSAYHISFASVALIVDDKEIKSEAPPMVTPSGTERFVLKGMTGTANAKAKVRFTNVSDYGNAEEHTVKLLP